MITDSTYTNSCSAVQNVTKAKIEVFHKRLKELYPCVDDVSKLPQAWSPTSRATLLGLTHDNLGCYFRGRRIDDEKATAAAKADNIIPPSCLLYYFEIEFISKGRDGYMGLGLSSDRTHIDKLPGWDRESYGYHADDGHIFEGNPRGHPFGPTSTTGDVVGCGYNLVEGKIFFTKNGLNLGKAFDDVPSNIFFYPTIGLKTPGEEILANFGQREFKYNIEQDLRSLRKNMTLTISNYPINDFCGWQNTLHKLVQSWLLQSSYPNTAEAFTKSTRIECKENMQRVHRRSRIQQLVMSGRISDAIKLTNRICPNLLQNNPNLLFALKCRQFIELISGAESDYQPVFNYNPESNKHDNNCAEQLLNNNCNSSGDGGVDMKFNATDDELLISFGQELSDYLHHLNKTYGRDDANEKMLLDAISLIAYVNPKSDPRIGKQLDPREREPISQMLNSSILSTETNESPNPQLEDVMNHLKTVVRMNNSQGRWLVDNLY